MNLYQRNQQLHFLFKKKIIILYKILYSYNVSNVYLLYSKNIMIHFEFLCLNFQGWEFFFHKKY